jgi:hypothetical protein
MGRSSDRIPKAYEVVWCYHDVVIQKGHEGSACVVETAIERVALAGLSFEGGMNWEPAPVLENLRRTVGTVVIHDKDFEREARRRLCDREAVQEPCEKVAGVVRRNEDGGVHDMREA